MKQRDNLRKIYVERLIEHAASDSRIVSLDTDSREATLADRFASVFPKRSISFGIAEQDMVSAAAGMATMGIIPFVNSYSMFIAMRALDQLRNVVAYPNLNVKFVISHHGLDTGADGVTHQLTEDVAIFRAIPNITMLHPADAAEMSQMVDWALAHQGPVIIKSGKSSVPRVHNDNYIFRKGVPSLFGEPAPIVIAANGVMVEKALAAQQDLYDGGVKTRVINVSTPVGACEQALLDVLAGARLVVTLEDHSIYGGIGGMIAEVTAQHMPIRILRLGLRDRFAECGPPSDLFAKYEMDSSALVRVVKRAIDDFPELLSN